VKDSAGLPAVLAGRLDPRKNAAILVKAPEKVFVGLLRFAIFC
jgi:hypothetical protein